MAELVLDEGQTLPLDNEPKGLPEGKAREYAVQLAMVEGGTDASLMLQKQMEIAMAGRVLTQREVVRSNKAFQEGSQLIADTKTQLEQVVNTVDVLNQFQEAAATIKKEELETKVVRQFTNTDPATNQILNERQDAVQVDNLRLANEIAFNNINTEIQAEADSFLGDLADLLESLGPAQIDEIINSPSTPALLEELQVDMANLPTDEFRAKWRSKFDELQEEKFFDNPDRVIFEYAILNRGSLNDARAASALRVIDAALVPGGVTAFKLSRALGQRAILNKALSPTLSSAPVKGVGVQIETVESLRARLPKEIAATKTTATKVDGITRLQAQAPITRGATVVVDPVSEAVTNAIKKKTFVSDAMVRAGGSKGIADDIAKSLEEPASPSLLGQEEQVAYALMGVTPTETLNAVPALISRALQRQDRILAQSTDLAIDSVGNVLTGKTLTTKLEQEAAADFTGGSVVNVSYNHTNEGILSGITAHVGAESGSPFATKAIAEQWLKDVKLTGEIFESETGGFLVNIQRAAEGVSDEVIAHARNSGWFRTLLFQPNDIIDADLQLLSRASEQSQSHVHNLFRETWNSGIKPMKAAERVQVEEVMQNVQRRTQMEGGAVWLSPDDFISEFKKVHGTDPKTKQVLGYLTAKQLEDASYRLLNRSLYKTKQAQGLQQVSYTGNSNLVPDTFAGKPATIDDIKPGEVLFHEATGEVKQFSKNVPAGISRESLETLLEANSLVKLEENVAIGQDGLAQYMLVPKNAIKFGELSPQQVGYLGGGRIKYDYNWIIHAKRNRTYDMFGGQKVDLSPVGLFGGKTRVEVRAFAEKLELGRKIARDESAGRMTLAEANTALQALKLPKFQTVGELTSFLKTRGVQLGDEITWNADGTVPTGDGVRALSEGEKIRAGIRNRAAKARTENRLEDVRGGYGIISPFEALSRSLSTASRHAAFSDYRQHALTAFSNSYGKFMEVKPGKGILPIQVVESKIAKEFKDKLPSGELANIFAHKSQILHTLRTETSVSKAWANTADSISDWFLKEKVIPLTSQRIADKLADARGANPVSKWKNIAFQSRLGLFSLPQFVLQASMAPSIVAMSPKHGVGAIMDVIPTRMALQANDPKMVKFLAERLNKARIWSKDEAADFVEFVQVYKTLGISDFGTSLPELAGASAGGVAQGKFSSFLDKGQVFFRTGEEIPRITAAGIAARKIRAEGIKLSSDEGKAKMITEVNRLTLGITGADVQIGMRGAASVPTQFWSFPMRMITALFGKSLTSGEKAGLYGSFAVLWGAGGIPMGDAMVDYYQEKWGADITQEEARLYYNGIVDTMIFNATDGEIKSDLSSRMLGNFVPSMVESFMENPTSTFIAGPAGSSFVDGMEILQRELEPVAAAGTGTFDQVTDAALGALAANITSVDRLFRGWLAYETGVLRDRKGRKTVSMSGTELALWAAGVPLQEFNDIYTQMDHLTNKIKDPARKIGLEMFNLHKRMFRDPSNKQIYKEQIIALRTIAIDRGFVDLALREYAKLMKDPEFVRQQQLRYDKDRMLGRDLPRTPSSQ